MNTRNRVAAVLLVCLLAFGVTACGSSNKGQTPQEAYKAAIAKTNELSGMDAQMEMAMTMSDGTESMDITMDAALKIQDMNKETMVMDMKMDIGLMGMAMTMQTYYMDGYYLMETMGQKIKYAMSLEEAMGQTAMIQEIGAEALGEIEMSEADGITTLSFEVDTAKMLEEGMMEEYMGMLENLGLSGMDESGMTYESLNGTVTINKDGYIASNAMHIGGSMEESGQKMDFTMDISVTFNNPGQDVTIDLPNVDDYMEVDPSMLG